MAMRTHCILAILLDDIEMFRDFFFKKKLAAKPKVSGGIQKRRWDRCLAEVEGDSGGVGEKGEPPEKAIHLSLSLFLPPGLPAIDIGMFH